MTTVLVTHDQEEALDVADRIAVLNKGRIEQVGDPATLYDRPANDFVMSFLGSVARLGGQLVRPHDIGSARDPDGGRPVRRPRATVTAAWRCTSGSRCGWSAAQDRRAGFSAQITRGDSEALGLLEGETVYVRPTDITG